MVEKAQVEIIFGNAIEIGAAEERKAFLDQACDGDLALRQETEKLVQDYFRAGEFLERPVAQIASDSIGEPVSEMLGTQIGPYKLREVIGEGGMGVVYVAEQTEPVRRKVALKIIKPGMDTKEVVARFEAERQALALMNHPNIARVFDGGATESGRPYFVMELVRGVPITEFCDHERLSMPQRLDLFLDVCRAVQHAHQKGIIHRDLKPSNVLVSEIDGSLVPKVIDFGVAKAVNQKLVEQTVYTQFSQMIGTPLYMSPEQAGTGVVDVDTRSDVYTLGVLLYELLTGSTPFDRDTMKNAGFEEVRRIIREEEPSRPSIQISTLQAETLSTLASSRRCDPRKLHDNLKGELDWIVMKALEKDRTRRYESASALVADIERYLNNEPVEACPPSATYRFKKLVRRHQVLLTTTTLVAASLLFGIAASVWQAMRANDEAATAAVEAERAREGLRIAIKGIGYTVGSLVDQRWIPQVRGTQRTMLLDSLALFDRLIELSPQDSQVHALRGQVHVALQNPEKAIQDFNEAIELDPLNHVAHYRLATLYLTYQERVWRDQKKAYEHITRAVEIAPDNTDYRIEHARIACRFDFELGLDMFDKAIELDPQNSVAYSSLADAIMSHSLKSQLGMALDAATKAVELDEQNAEAYRMLGRAQTHLGLLEDAVESFDKAKKLAPFQHYNYRDRGECLRDMKRFEEAIADYQAGWELAPDYYIYPKRIGQSYAELQQYFQAIDAIRIALKLGPGDASTITDFTRPEQFLASRDAKVHEEYLQLVDDYVEWNHNSTSALVTRALVKFVFGQQNAALADLKTVISRNDANDYRRYQTALLSLSLGDTSLYRICCQQMLEAFADSDDNSDMLYTVWACVLGPHALDDYAVVLQLARRAVEEHSSRQHFYNLGAILMRAGQYAEAKKRLEEARHELGTEQAYAAHIHYFLAMTEQRLGNSVEARALLNVAEQLPEQEITGSYSRDRKLMLEMLRIEVRQLFDESIQAQ